MRGEAVFKPKPRKIQQSQTPCGYFGFAIPLCYLTADVDF